MKEQNSQIFKNNWKDYLRLGLVPYPASRTGKGPIVPWSRDLPHPCMDDYAEWEEKYSDANIWVLLGDGYLVIDPDNREAEDFVRSLNLPEGPISISGKRSAHRWFKTSINLHPIKINPVGNNNINLEVRTGHNGMLVPPSIHPETKRQYVWQDGHSPWEIPFVDLPIEAYHKIRALADGKTSQHNHRDADWHEELLNGVSEGTRNDSLTRLAGRYIQKGLSKEEVLPILLNVSSKCDPPLEIKEVEKIVDSISKTELRKHPAPQSVKDEILAIAETSVDYKCTESGNAEFFSALYGDRYVFVSQRKKWFSFDNVHWVEDDHGAVLKMLETVRFREKLALELKDNEKKKNIIKWAIASESRMRLEAALKLAQAMLLKDFTLFDYDPKLLCCKNGVVDLETGELRNATKDDWLCKSTNLDFCAEAKSERWLQFLSEVFNGDTELIDFIHRAVGYTLTGLTNEQCFFILYGVGANGKSVFLGILEKLLGDYGITTPSNTFKDKPNDSNSNDIARMVGARFVKSIEVKEGVRLNEERIKSLTGCDRVTARFLYNEYFEFNPRFKLWMAVNHKPIVHGTEDAIWRRIRLIPFEVTFPPEKQDKDLSSKLAKELSGILSWAVDGCLEWQKRGLEPVEKVIRETSLYREESDLIVQFLAERTSHKSGGKVKASDLYQEYKYWCQKRGENYLNNTQFGNRMKEKGFKKEKKTHVYYLDLELVDPLSSETESKPG